MKHVAAKPIDLREAAQPDSVVVGDSYNMPVVKPDERTTSAMPVIVPDTTGVAKMPVVKSGVIAKRK